MASEDKKPPLVTIELALSSIEECANAQKCISDPHKLGVIALVDTAVNLDPDSDLNYVGKVTCPGSAEVKKGTIFRRLVKKCNIDVACVTYHDNGQVKPGDISKTFSARLNR